MFSAKCAVQFARAIPILSIWRNRPTALRHLPAFNGGMPI
jgi:hypothetical protein